MTDAPPTPSRPVVGIVGTFDVANFGDLLFPELAAHELEQRLGPIELRRYSHRPMAAPPWPYEVRPLDELIGSIQDLDLVVVGGGHLIRFDTAVAPGYEAVAATVPHPGGYWLSPTLMAAAAGVPVAWNAIGASPDTPPWARSLLASALESVDYVSVRDGDSLAELAAIGSTVPIRLVPDTAFGIRALLDARGSPTLPFEAELAGRPYIVIQSSAALKSRAAEIRLAVDTIDRADLAVVELPVSPVLGDRIGILGDLGTGVMRVDPWPDPLTLARIIAGARAVVAHSLHLSIVALAHGVPVFRATTQPGTKYAELGSFSGVSTIVSGDDLTQALMTTTQAGVSTQVQERVSQLAAHWDRVAALFAMRSSEDRARRHLVARRTLAMVPAIVADADAHGHEQRAQLASTAAALDAAHDEQRELSSRYAATTEKLVDAAHRATELAKQVGALEVEVARERAQGAADRRRSEREIAKRRTELTQTRAELRDVRHKAAALDRLRRRRSFRAVMLASRTARRLLRAVGIGKPQRGASDADVRRHTTATIEQEQAAHQALLSTAPGSTRTDGPLVSIIILNRDGAEHLRRLLPAIERTLYRSFEVIVVDNASSDDSLALLEDSSTRLPLTVIRNTENRAFGQANDQAAAAATGELILFLNNDVEPLGGGWLGRLVDTLERRGATAVGARLVYPRRPSLDNSGDRVFPDLTLQHRGIAFVAADGVPTGQNLGTGADPSSAEAVRVQDAPAVTAACMLVRHDAFAAVGGFTEGYVYGTEDVDLSMKLRAAGGTIVYDGGAVLWHHEYGTQNAEGRDWKRRNRTRNRQVFVDRWGPQAFREVFRDRVLGEGRWSETPLHVAVTLTRDDPAGAWGDYYTAHELGDALAGLGWRVTYAERYRDRWYELDPSVDVVISLLDTFDVRRIPRGVVSVAWVRNWTERWITQPWFDEFDIVLASSARSREIIVDRTSRWPSVVPLATNARQFAPRPSTDALRSDLLFVGNHWGARRTVEDVLPELAGDDRDRVIRVYGRGWENTDLAPFHGGVLAYERLPDAYASAAVVIDDTAGPTLPYGAVNSRVFDALAAGAFVVSDNEVGVRELFGGDFPVARNAVELEARVAWAEANPDAVAELQGTFRQVVLDRHTYDHRATEIRDHLLAWVDAERYAILVGVPDWEHAESWGDYHFARGLQRQLERRGHPTRIHLLDDWNRSPSARADVAIHLHGLSDHRPRPSQLNLLWIISHPDRVSPEACGRYDRVFVASDTFAAELANRVTVPVIPLHQATDPDRFAPDPTGPTFDLLFVGNTRGVRRAIVDDLTPTTHDLAIFGKGWTPDLVDPIYVRGAHVPNESLHRYYSSARIVLNDHWADMRAHGFLSNRLYDALASGAFVISDDATGVDAEFDGAVVTYSDRDELRRLVDQYLAEPGSRRELGERGRAIVIAHHTFGHRVDRVLEEVASIGLSRPMRVEGWAEIDAWLDRRRRGLMRSDRGDHPKADADQQAVVMPSSAASTPR